jgi:hypothetical protein
MAQIFKVVGGANKVAFIGLLRGLKFDYDDSRGFSDNENLAPDSENKGINSETAKPS